MTAGANVPRWQRVIEEALDEDKNANVYQAATLETRGTSSRASDVIPHVRSLVHRDFIAPLSPARPLLLTTTDVRTPKAAQLSENPVIEIAWWLPKAQAQMRISGKAFMYPSGDFNTIGSENPGIGSIAASLRQAFPAAKFGGENFDWEAESKSRFETMSGHMRASWVRPVPGTRLHDIESAKKWPETLPKMEEAIKGSNEEKKALVQEALRNFAIVLIEPSEVDYVELGVTPNRRTRFFLESDEWKEEALVP